MWASVLRSAPDGSIDSSFSSELHGILRSIAIQSNGRILAAGELFTQDGRRYALDRLLSDGSPDPEGVGVAFAVDKGNQIVVPVVLILHGMARGIDDVGDEAPAIA